MLALDISVEAYYLYIFRDLESLRSYSLRESQSHAVVSKRHRLVHIFRVRCEALCETLAARVPEVPVEDAVLIDRDPVLLERILIRLKPYLPSLC